MDIDQQIKDGFDNFVKLTFQSKDMQRFFLNHERRHIVEENLKREIKSAFHVIKDAETINSLIKSVSHMFCNVALEVKAKELGAKDGKIPNNDKG